MVDVLTIRVDQARLQKIDGVLKRVRNKLPELTSKGMFAWGKILEKDMKMSARDAGIVPFTNTLFTTGIQWRQRPRGKIGRLFIRLYGIALDQMAPHFVNLTRRRSRLLAWAEQSKSSAIRRAARAVRKGEQSKATIRVRPHPFIMNGWRRARPKLRPVLSRFADRIKAEAA